MAPAGTSAKNLKWCRFISSSGQEYFVRRHSQNFPTRPRLFRLVAKHGSGWHKCEKISSSGDFFA
jgi:hypothetical protein